MKPFIYLLFSIILFSCSSKKDETLNVSQQKNALSITYQQQPVEAVKPKFYKEIEDWKALNTLNVFIKRFENVSPNEALINASELKGLVKELKDSISPKIFNLPSFKARVNVFYNEALRLADLTDIPAISSSEVNMQVTKTLEAFSAVNSKINNLLTKKEFEDMMTIPIDYIGIDSTQIDSISKKSILSNKKEAMLKKKQLKLPVPKRNLKDKK